MESYIQICTGEFKMQNDQNIYTHQIYAKCWKINFNNKQLK